MNKKPENCLDPNFKDCFVVNIFPDCKGCPFKKQEDEKKWKHTLKMIPINKRC